MNMANVVQRIGHLARKTFLDISSKVALKENIADLKGVLQTLNASDLNFEERLVENRDVYRPETRGAPVTYVHIYEDRILSIGIFVIRHGASLPLHDHPDMHGLIKVIHGQGKIKSFTSVPKEDIPFPKEMELNSSVKPWHRDRIIPVKLHSDTVVDSDSVCELGPEEGNLHYIEAVNGPMAFVDILSPPYDHDTGARVCHYYKELNIEKDVTGSGIQNDICWLLEIPQPSDYWTASAKYKGPRIAIDMDSF
ncbi:2-aminoethanethiol dioxygenase [Lingula anatina]|uniref:2-aminoethanethiol dioxygenase n=1 Tax=Lingula anatina TaxID=7574 RepID=A0A1S3HAQ3_LINAN|nr:2-aminoethanethiol dioxygenase [Lingula anatina]|eukprot:XP_013383160.1 2-aminoethanethiol dioxygenase [Lingula anatina]